MKKIEKKLNSKNKPGPKAETLKLSVDWESAIEKALKPLASENKHLKEKHEKLKK